MVRPSWLDNLCSRAVPGSRPCYCRNCPLSCLHGLSRSGEARRRRRWSSLDQQPRTRRKDTDLVAEAAQGHLGLAGLERRRRQDDEVGAALLGEAEHLEGPAAEEGFLAGGDLPVAQHPG